MKRTLLTASTAMAMLFVGVAHAEEIDRTGWPDSFTVGTASQGGTFFAYGSGWANLVADELGVSGGGEVSGGPWQNLANVHTGNNAFAMTTMGPAAAAMQGENPLAPGLVMDKACAMFPLYQTPFSIPALASQLEGQTDITIIERTEEEQAKALADFPVAPLDIPAETYSTLTEPARAVSMWNFAIANCDLPESFVKAAVDTVMSDNDRMVSIHRAAASTLPENWDKNQVLMWHPGAAAWFNENGGSIPPEMIYGGGS